MGTNLKALAAARAVELVSSGMILGLGTGTTANHAIEMIGARMREGSLRDIVGIPTSNASARLAEASGIRLTTLVENPTIDLTIDGADEIGPDLTLIKGQGGALLREKIVACASKQEIIVADFSKLVEQLGTLAPVAVEVIPFGWLTYVPALRALQCDPILRMRGSSPFVTDEGNYILDCRFSSIADPGRLEREIKQITGVVESGLFVSLTSLAIVASAAGIRELTPHPRG